MVVTAWHSRRRRGWWCLECTTVGMAQQETDSSLHHSKRGTGGPREWLAEDGGVRFATADESGDAMLSHFEVLLSVTKTCRARIGRRHH